METKPESYREQIDAWFERVLEGCSPDVAEDTAPGSCGWPPEEDQH